ncbi:MAG: DNA-directed RNA polymerase subunit H [Nanoarchaeota archaeon]|jgi:DNA-directed RNA polymerase subunit H|nr:DNA-directed RNA polymerase subunit H [Nanoarchaeota archaeon]
MHILQPKQIKLNEKESNDVLEQLNISRSQLPKVFASDAGLPEDCIIGDIIRIERKDGDETNVYFRVVV